MEAIMFEDGICSYCGKETSEIAGNPSLWPLRFTDPGANGVTSAHHVGCVKRRLKERDLLLEALRAWDKSERHMATCRHCSAGRPCSPSIVRECQEASRLLQSALVMVEADLQ